jgi:anti-sigma factor RsiW
MTDHIPLDILSGLADGELSSDEFARASEHLAACPSCTSRALEQTMLKSTAAKAGRRHDMPTQLQQRLVRMAREERSQLQGPPESVSTSVSPRFTAPGWAPALAMLLVVVSVVLGLALGFIRIPRAAHTSLLSSGPSSPVTEVCDQHIAMLAANSPPQVVSSDRHTVKPWFQGKLPFSFNLPEKLPDDTTLDGADLTYLGSQPAAQLLYSIGRHRISVFIRQVSVSSVSPVTTEHSGFHLVSFTTNDLEVVAVSDVDPVRLSDLVSRIGRAQTAEQR